MNIFKKLYFFNLYRKNIKKNEQYLKVKYGLNIDNINRLWTTFSISDAPKEIKKEFGIDLLLSKELTKYVAHFNSDLPKLDLNELIILYKEDIVKINNENVGITFGFSLMNNIKVYYYLTLFFILGLLLLFSIGYVVYFFYF
jgi:hypothetical protein